VNRKFYPLPSLEYLLQRLIYDPEQGKLFWKTSDRNGWVGKQAGWLMNNGYVMLDIDGRAYLAHRIAWYIHTGEDPIYDEIDHVDKNKENFKINNLRKATHSENMINVPTRKDNTSGHKGVNFNKRLGKWSARIQKDSKRMFLGYFDSIDDAIEAYRSAASIHGNFYSA
jgi:hypothetical protein